MSVLARRMARAFYYFNRAKPDMRKSNEVRFPNGTAHTHLIPFCE